MTDVNQELEQAVTRMAEVFRKHCETKATPADVATLMLSREVNLLTLQLERIEERLTELIEPFKTTQPSRH